MLSNQDLKLINEKYDVNNNGKIFYPAFVDDVNEVSQGYQRELEVVVKNIYDVIR